MYIRMGQIIERMHISRAYDQRRVYQNNSEARQPLKGSDTLRNVLQDM